MMEFADHANHDATRAVDASIIPTVTSDNTKRVDLHDH